MIVTTIIINAKSASTTSRRSHQRIVLAVFVRAGINPLHQTNPIFTGLISRRVVRAVVADR
jgi:hypothetical protein